MTTSVPRIVIAGGGTDTITLANLDNGPAAPGRMAANTLTTIVLDADDATDTDLADDFIEVLALPLNSAGGVIRTDHLGGAGNDTFAIGSPGNVLDLIAINRAIFTPSLVTPLCDTTNDGLCDVRDLIGANLKIFGRPAYCSRYPPPGQ